jgi:hypothetical protein
MRALATVQFKMPGQTGKASLHVESIQSPVDAIGGEAIIVTPATPLPN